MKVTNTDTISAYDRGVQAYYTQSPQTVSDHVKKWIDEVLKDLPQTAKILEIGSGTGKDARYITSLGYDMELTDASQGFVDFLNNNGQVARVFNVLVDELKDNYDVILADAVLLHFTEDELTRVLTKVAQVLNPGGRLAFTVKRGDGDFTESEKLGNIRYFHLWQPSQLQKMLQNCGLVVVYQNEVEDTRDNKPAWIMIVAQKMEAV